MANVKDLSPTARTVLMLLMAVPVVALILFASSPTAKDYIAYWSSGHLFVQGADPYKASSILAVEQSAGYTPARPIVMRNPPPALLLVAPLGWLSARLGLLLWTVLGVGCVAVSLWALEVSPRDRILGYIFAPVIACFSSGQSSPILLLGVALFLRWNRTRPLVAGLILALLAIKPHVFLIFWLVLLLDSLYRKSFRTLAGMAFMIGAASALVTWIDGEVWRQFVSMLRAEQIATEFLPTLATLLRISVAPNRLWIQFIPSVIALVWATWFYWRNHAAWDWRWHGLLILFATIISSPYAWATDEVILLPAMMAALASPEKPKYGTFVLALTNGVAFVLVACQFDLSSPAYVWTPLAWLGAFLYCTRPWEGMSGGEGVVAQERPARVHPQRA